MEPALATNVVRTGASAYFRPSETGIKTSNDIRSMGGLSYSTALALLDDIGTLQRAGPA